MTKRHIPDPITAHAYTYHLNAWYLCTCLYFVNFAYKTRIIMSIFSDAILIVCRPEATNQDKSHIENRLFAWKLLECSRRKVPTIAPLETGVKVILTIWCFSSICECNYGRYSDYDRKMCVVNASNWLVIDATILSCFSVVFSG